jgi:hypothetical protein
MSTVADMPKTRKKRRAFPAISLKDVMVLYCLSICVCVYAIILDE